jgi:DNA-binding LytR/AlgR family response regulator
MTIAINQKCHENVLSQQIVMLRGEANYTVFYLNNGRKIMNSHTLKNFDRLLKTEGFLRVHRAYLVNPAYLSWYDEMNKRIVMKNGMNAQVSRRKSGVMREFLNRTA